MRAVTQWLILSRRLLRVRFLSALSVVVLEHFPWILWLSRDCFDLQRPLRSPVDGLRTMARVVEMPTKTAAHKRSWSPHAAGVGVEGAESTGIGGRAQGADQKDKCLVHFCTTYRVGWARVAKGCRQEVCELFDMSACGEMKMDSTAGLRSESSAVFGSVATKSEDEHRGRS